MNFLRSTFLLIALATIFASCSDTSKIKEGEISYAVDYPDHKDNFFLYSILPKEMELKFKDGKMQSLIKKVDLQNALLVDCNKKEVKAYFQYGTEAFSVELQPSDIKQMLSDQKDYSVVFTKDEKDILGFNAKKAIATCKTDKNDKIALWYTEDIELKNSNWYNPFKEIPGVLLEYAIDRYGIRMEFKATKFDNSPLSKSDLELPITRNSKSYKDYNTKLNGLFKPFE